MVFLGFEDILIIIAQWKMMLSHILVQMQILYLERDLVNHDFIMLHLKMCNTCLHILVEEQQPVFMLMKTPDPWVHTTYHM